MQWRMIFEQTDRWIYRDPAAFEKEGTVYLFFTYIENAEDGQYMYVGESESRDLIDGSEPVMLTPRDRSLNYSSPGNVLRVGEEYILCIQTYPRPQGELYGTEDSRIFGMRSKDLRHWTEPELLRVKGDIPVKDMGRMIDPYLLEDEGIYRCFYKQNGVSFSTSRDLVRWTFQGSADCGENVCVLKDGKGYLILHSPENGIGLIRTEDFRTFRNCGLTTLDQPQWAWAKDRVTAGFVLKFPGSAPEHRYILFFHGDNEDVFGHPHGASLAMLFFDDFRELFPAMEAGGGHVPSDPAVCGSAGRD